MSIAVRNWAVTFANLCPLLGVTLGSTVRDIVRLVVTIFMAFGIFKAATGLNMNDVFSVLSVIAFAGIPVISLDGLNPYRSKYYCHDATGLNLWRCNIYCKLDF